MGIILGSIMGVVREDTRCLDYRCACRGWTLTGFNRRM